MTSTSLTLSSVGIPVIGIYAQDLNPGAGGDIYYRSTSDDSILQRAFEDIGDEFCSPMVEFTMVHIFTYIEVALFGGGSDGPVCIHNCIYHNILSSNLYDVKY